MADLTYAESRRLSGLQGQIGRTDAEEAEMQALIAKHDAVPEASGPVPAGEPVLAGSPAPYAPSFPLADGSVGAPALYRLTQMVWAIPIEGVRPEPHGGVTLMLGDDFAPLVVPSTLVAGYAPGPGDFLVILPDGTQVIRDKGRFGVDYELGTAAAKLPDHDPRQVQAAQDAAAKKVVADKAAADEKAAAEAQTLAQP